MTVGIKPPNDRYLQLMSAFPPRPINCDTELEAAQKQVNAILDAGPLGADEKEYLRLLGILICEYEDRCEPIFELTEVEKAIALESQE